MPRASVWLIRLALLHLLVATILGGWLLVAKSGMTPPPSSTLSTHAAVALLGWLVQFTLGVGYWILPKHATGPARGPTWAPWTTLATLNTAIILTALNLPILALSIATLSILIFLTTTIPRLKPFGRPP